MTEETSSPEVASGAPEEPEPRARIDIAEALTHATWVDAVCLGGIVLSVVAGLLSYPLSAFLLAHIKVHLVATASVSALLTGGASLFNRTDSLAVVLPLAVVGLAKFDAFFFWAGRRYGDDVAQFIEEQGSIRPSTVARAERWVARFGPPLLTASFFIPVPSRLVMVLLGASGVSWVAFWVADLIGTVAWISTFLVLGHHFHTQVDHIAKVVNHYSLLVGIGLFVVVLIVVGFRSRKQLAA